MTVRPVYRVTPEPRSAADIVFSILLLLVPPVALFFYTVFALFVAFGEADNPNNPDDWFLITVLFYGVCIVVAIIGTIVTIVRLVHRRRGWSVALVCAIIVSVATLLSIEHWAYVFG